VDLQVDAGGQPLPFGTINSLGEGDTLRYAPVLLGKEKRPGKVALVLVPEKREAGQEDIIVTDPQPADKPHECKMPQTISLVALVYGPAGLDRKNVAKYLSQDEGLVAHLADDADRTEQAQQLVATLSNSASSSASVNSALNSFAAQYGFVVQLDRNAPVATQAATVFAAMNPQLTAYNPLASSTAQSVAQASSIASIAGTLFFGSPVGLVSGGTAMLLRAIAFPRHAIPAVVCSSRFRVPVPVSTCAANKALCRLTHELPTYGQAASRTSGCRLSALATPILFPPARRRLFQQKRRSRAAMCIIRSRTLDE
jgi:hypothetical protein